MNSTPDYDIHSEIIEQLQGIQGKRIIILKGGQGSGKTTEACKIAESLGKPVEVITMKQDVNDNKLYASIGAVKHDVTSKQTKPILDAIRKNKHRTLICDDWETIIDLARKKREAVENKQFINELRSNDIHLILVFHNQKPPKQLLERTITLLILKECNAKKTSLDQYLKKQRISLQILETVNHLSGFDTLYLFKDGKYLKREHNKYIKDMFIPTGAVKQDLLHKATYDLTEKGLTHKEVLDKYEELTKYSLTHYVIKGHINNNTELFSKYEEAKKERVKKNKNKHHSLSGHWEKPGIHVHYETSTLKPKLNISKEMRENYTKITRPQEIGDIATNLIGDIIIKLIRENKDRVKGNYIHITINEKMKKPIPDIIIENDQGQKFEVEVKNWKQTKHKKSFHPSDIKGTKNKNGIMDKFSQDATKKYLFSCGLGFNKNSLKTFHNITDIQYYRITKYQIKQNDKIARQKIKDKLKDSLFMKNFLTEK
jgi:hypothetical protein